MILLIECFLSFAAAAAAFAFPTLRSRSFEACERACAVLAKRRSLAVVVVGLAALAARAALLPILPIPVPTGHDEFGYLLLADTFAHGRLTNPTHPMWVHFESIHIIWRPTYTAKFYPAQGLIMALGQVLLGHPFWGVWLSLGLMCAAICWMLQGWLPPGWALLGGFLAVIRLGTFSYWADSYCSGAVAAFGGALVLGALPRIMCSQRVRDALLMGLGFAVIANSRPYEGLFFGLPVAGVLAVWALGRNRPPLRVTASRLVVPLLLVLILAGSGMAYYFWRTTGSPWTTPYMVDARTYNPVPYFPWGSLRPAPVYHHAVMREYFLGTVLSQYEESRSVRGNVKEVLTVLLRSWMFYLGGALALPLVVVVATLPYGFSWKDIGSSTRFLLLVCGIVIVCSMLPLTFLPHYVAPITSALLALPLQAMRRLRPQQWRGRPAGVFITRAVPLICLATLTLQVCANPLHLRRTFMTTNVERAIPRTPARHSSLRASARRFVSRVGLQ